MYVRFDFTRLYYTTVYLIQYNTYTIPTFLLVHSKLNRTTVGVVVDLIATIMQNSRVVCNMYLQYIVDKYIDCDKPIAIRFRNRYCY